LGIARALLKDAPIIVLDEATSALDTEAEPEIQQALVAVMKGRTVLAIAHRLSTVAKFDQLVVLREGRIVEQGTPAELRRRGRAVRSDVPSARRRPNAVGQLITRDRSAEERIP
jgi:ATP-binding cassette subfamily B protein